MNVDYVNLPIGLNRRLSYSYYVKSRARLQRRIYQEPLEYRGMVFPVDYNFNNLIDIEKGIISKNLFEKSNVKLHEFDCNCKCNCEFECNFECNPEFECDFECKCQLECAICREKIYQGEIIREIQCKHVYHINCIDLWFTENKTCPQCRLEI